jgi:hypothetical protein
MPDDRCPRRVGLVAEGALPEQVERQRRDRSGGTHYKAPNSGPTANAGPAKRLCRSNGFLARIGGSAVTPAKKAIFSLLAQAGSASWLPTKP